MLEQKVVLYITRGREVLVFDHHEHDPDVPPTQVPRGTVDAGEAPLQTALREAYEETGLRLSRAELLASAVRRFTFRGQAFETPFHYFWLEAPAETPDAWSHTVTAGELDKGHVYHCRFVPLDKARLVWDMDKFIPELALRINASKEHA